MRPVTPRGFRDVLPREAAEREVLSAAAAGVFAAWGYEPVEMPAVEVYGTLTDAAGDLEATAFRLFDSDGRLLALRPDMTVPIARMVASRMGEVPGAKRLRYAGEVFREHESLRGQARQFTQVGIELVDAAGAVADAEVIAVMVETLQALGLPEFTVALGDVAPLFALLDAAGGDVAWRNAVLAAAHDRNLVAFDALTRSGGVVPEVGAALRDVVATRGGGEAIARCHDTVTPFGGGGVLEELACTWELLEELGVTERIVVDFGITRAFDYYTGIVLEAYAPGIGVPLGAGGRYDGVLAAYGTPAPAVGFALGLERVTVALAEQDAVVEIGPAAILVGGEARAAFAEAARVRAAGRRAVLAAGMTGETLADEAARRGLEAVEAR